MRAWTLASRPAGLPNDSNFAMVETPDAPLGADEFRVANSWLSVDPYMRGRMSDSKSYVPPFALGKPLDGGAVGEVIESRSKEVKQGDVVVSSLGWREYFIAAPKALHLVSPDIQPLSVYLGALGMTGMTAWAGLNLVEVKLILVLKLIIFLKIQILLKILRQLKLKT